MKKRVLTFLCILSLIIGMAVPSLAATTQTEIIKTMIPKTFPVVKQVSNATLVTFWSSMSGKNAVAVDNIVNWFNATVGKQKKIYVKSIFQGGYDDIAMKVQASIQTKNVKALPDLAILNPQGAFALKESEYIIYIGDLAAKDKSADILSRLDKNAIAACSYKGRMLGMPFANSVLVLHYNADAFRAVGLDAGNPPKTFAEVAEVAKKLVIRGEKNSIKRYGFTNRLDSMWFPTYVGRQKGGLGAVMQFDMDEGRSGIPTKLSCAEDGTLKEVLSEWKKIVDTGCMDYKTASPRSSFEQGFTAMYTDSMVNYNTIQNYFKSASKKRFENKMASLPSVHADDGNVTHVSGSAVYMFNRQDETKKNATWEFVKFLTSVDVSSYWAVETSYFALNTEAIKSDYMHSYFKNYPNVKVVYDIRKASNVNTKAQAPMIPNASQYQNYTADQIILMSQGKQNVDKTIENIAKKVKQILNTWGKAHA